MSQKKGEKTMNGLKIITVSAVTATALFAQSEICENEGWKLLGATNNINVTQKFTNASEIATVWSYNSNTKKWQLHIPGNYNFNYSSYDLETLDTINTGQGYWVHCKSAQSGSDSTDEADFDYYDDEDDLSYGANVLSSFDFSNITSFFIIEDYDDELTIGHFSRNGTSASYKEYKHEDGSWMEGDYTETFTIDIKNPTTLSAIFSNKTEEFKVLSAKEVVSVDGKDISSYGLKEVTFEFEVTSHNGEVYDTDDWWDIHYYDNDNNLVTNLNHLKDLLVDQENGYWVWINEDTFVKPQPDGTNVRMVWDGTYWASDNDCPYDDGCKNYKPDSSDVLGTWTINSNYLIVDVPGEGTVAFKEEDGRVVQTERAAVGKTDIEKWYYGVTLDQMKNLVLQY